MPLRSLLAVCTGLATPLALVAQTQTVVPPVTPVVTVPPATPTPAAPPRFADLTGPATPAAVAGPAQTVTSLAEAIRLGLVTPANPSSSSLLPTAPLTQAVTQASTAIVREGQAIRATSLAGRQSAVTRLRLAQTEAERLKLLADLRLQAGDRLDEQREVARLVRDRLRQVRDNATLNRPAAP